MREHFEFEGIIQDLFLDNTNEFNDTEKKSSFSAELIVKAVGDVSQGVGNVAQAIAKKKEAETRILEIGGKRQAQLKDCENNKAYKKFADLKYRRNRIKDCQEEVKKRLNAEEEEQKSVIRRMTNIEENKLTTDLEKEKSSIDEKKSSKKLYVVGGIISLVLILGTIIYLKKKG